MLPILWSQKYHCWSSTRALNEVEEVAYANQ